MNKIKNSTLSNSITKAQELKEELEGSFIKIYNSQKGRLRMGGQAKNLKRSLKNKRKY